ncbi:DUF982 domain-containing protein [Mesorhizobium sp. IRAMC:0171]|uniref:DUF982 domain-containing protein n=2 Tax=Mesorhizobium retamae TaxID=2912854 RepID=A0ABS9QK28_9HYPH|nr:DUF982 domain-containing protein [Mesorhizobium sp. IRAMC:0171]
MERDISIDILRRSGLFRAATTDQADQANGGIMPPFKAVIFRTTRDYKIPVTTLYDVERAMGMSWPNKSSDSYRSAACILEQAKLGWCSPRAAFDAFVFAAQEQGRIVECRRLKDRVARELASIEPETIRPERQSFGHQIRRRARVTKPILASARVY